MSQHKLVAAHLSAAERQRAREAENPKPQTFLTSADVDAHFARVAAEKAEIAASASPQQATTPAEATPIIKPSRETPLDVQVAISRLEKAPPAPSIFNN